MSNDLTASKADLVNRFANKYSIDEGKFLDTLKATAFKQKEGVQITNEQMTMLLVVADQYGLNPFTKEIYAYPDKGAIVPVVSIDGWLRIVNENPQMDGLEFAYSPETSLHKGKVVYEWVDCIITRKDRAKPIVVREFLDEVMRTVNFATPWDTHPKRMHRHKAMIQAARLAFGFAGIYDQDEAERIIDVSPAQPRTQAAKPAEKVTLEYCPDAHFEAKACDVLDHETGEIKVMGWQSIVQSGKKTSADLIAVIETKYLFTDEQKAKILSWEQK